MFLFLLKLFGIQQNNRKAIGYFEGWVSIVINLIISAIKGFYAAISGSIALLADAVHSLSDVISSVIVIVAFKYSTKGADSKHPFGHGRIENIASIIIATLLMVVSFEFLMDSIERIIHPKAIQINIWILIILTITILLKELLARLSIFLGKMINSSSLMAEGYHHRTDAISTIIVIIGFIATKYNIYYADGIVGIIVSIFILHTAIDLVKDASKDLIGEKASPEIFNKIIEITKTFPEVLGAHDIIVHNFGNLYSISLHIEISDTIDILQAHTLAEKVEKKISGEFPGHTVVHIDPINNNHPLYTPIINFLKDDLVKKYPYLHSAHDIRIIGEHNHFNIVFDINVEPSPKLHKEIQEIRKKIINKFNANDVVINIDLPL